MLTSVFLKTIRDMRGQILGWGVGTIPDYACYFLQPGSGWNVGLYDSEEFDALCNDFFD